MQSTARQHGASADSDTSTPATAISPVTLLPPLVSPERGLDTPLPGPSVGGHRRPQAAFDGSLFLVAWNDSKIDHGGMRVARVTPGGIVLDPTGIPVGSGAEPRVAAGNGIFLIIFETAGPSGWNPPRIRGIRVGSDGTVLDPEGIDIGDGWDPAIAFDGTRFMVTWSRQSMIHRARVTPGGEVLDPGGEAVLPASYPGQTGIACDGTDCMITWPEGRSMRSAVLDAQGNPVGAGVQVLETVPDDTDDPFFPSPARVVFDGSHYVAAWAVYERIESSALPPGAGAIRTISAQPGLRAMRLTRQNTPVDPAPIPITSEATELDAMAFDGSQVLMLPAIRYTSCESILAIARLGADGEAPPPVSSESFFPAGEATLVAGNGRTLMVWVDHGQPGLGARNDATLTGAWLGGDGSFDGSPFAMNTSANTQSEPSIAFDGQSYLVTWVDSRGNSKGDRSGIYGARVTPSGLVLDPVGIEIAASDRLEQEVQPRAVFDGRNTVVLWGEAHQECHDFWWLLKAARVSPQGQVLDTTPIHLGLDFWSSYTVAGSNHGVLVYEPENNQIAHIDQDGVVTGPDTLHILGGTLADASGMASDGSNYLLVIDDPGGRSGTGKSIVGVLLDARGNPVDDRLIPIGAGAGPIEVGFDGTNYVVAWKEIGLHVARVAPDGQVLDPDGIRVGQDGFACPGSQGSITATAMRFDGVHTILTWQTEPSYGAPSDVMGAVITADGTTGACFSIASSVDSESLALGSAGLGTSLVAYTDLVEGEPFHTRRVRTRYIDSGSAVACPTGFVVDGVCCDSACGGGNADDCMACSVRAGAAADGVCAPVADGAACAGGTCAAGMCMEPGAGDQPDAGPGMPDAGPGDPGPNPGDPGDPPGGGGCSATTPGPGMPAWPGLLALALLLALRRRSGAAGATPRA